jgi:hypothetical protein
MRFSTIYQPTALFSLKNSMATNSGAKSLFLPSPYAIKMAILNQAITTEGVDFNGKHKLYFDCIKETQIEYRIMGSICVNNAFVKILKPERPDGKEEGESIGFSRTVAFREYIHLTGDLEIIFSHKRSDLDDILMPFLQKFLHKINYFGKRGCFFQFVEYVDNPNEPNVLPFNMPNFKSGILQKFDDFDDSAKNFTFDNVNSYTSLRTSRKEVILTLPIKQEKTSKSYTYFSVIK